MLNYILPLVSSLLRSLESNNLLDIVEAICQDIQLSQHPFCFDHSSDNTETELFHSFRQRHTRDNSMPTYHLSHSDTLSLYIPRKMLSILSVRDVASNTLPYNLCDLAAIGSTKYERSQLRNLLISTSNIDYLLNKVSIPSLADIDDDNNPTSVTNESTKTDSSSVNAGEQNAFLSPMDLDDLHLELNNCTDSGFQNFLSECYILLPGNEITGAHYQNTPASSFPNHNMTTQPTRKISNCR